MEYLIIGSIVGLVLTIALGIWAAHDYEWHNVAAGVVAIITGIVTLIAVTLVICYGFEWKSSEHKANIINREYDTAYTQEEVFYASDVIDTVRELDRKRVELNGNLLNE